ncbi:flagellar filament capping protein FliD [Paracoccaceae bacterium]|nr:flagellar filament capping protein FliD [Paracoccaceae bacterium]
MVEVAKPDYLSLVNKSGSGFNVSELVTSIVAAEIEPKKSIHNAKQTKNENAISGIGFLNASSSVGKTAFTAIQNDKFFSVSSSSASTVAFTATDETKLTSAVNSVSNITIAKKMVFELPGFTDLTGPYNQAVSIKLGSWAQTSTASSSTSNSVESGKTYKVITRSGSSASDGNAFDEYTRDPNDTSDADAFHGTPIEVDDVFRASQAFTDNNYTFSQVDAYSFTANDSTTANITLSGNLQAVTSQLNAVTGISAKLVNTGNNGAGNPVYSIVVSGVSTGNKSGFQITASGAARWETSAYPGGNTNNNSFNQFGTDASLNLDGVTVSRTTNTITDLIDGVSINLKADSSGTVQYTASRSETDVKNTVEKVISSLNDYKKELDRLTFIDVDGGDNGPLAMDPAVGMLKSKLKKLTMSALTGHAEKNIYLSNLGIKTNSSGEYYFDKVTFGKTYTANPEYFSALKDDNISSNLLASSVVKSQFTKIPSGTYEVKYDGTSSAWKFGDTTLTRVAYNGGSKFTSVTYPGLVIETTAASPDAFKIFVGKSFSQSFVELAESILSTSSSIKAAETAYTTSNADISEKLDKLATKEKLLTTRYTTQFGEMEQAMTQFNSTKTLLENFIESWKKQK